MRVRSPSVDAINMNKYENLYNHVLTDGFPVHVLDILASHNRDTDARISGLINAARSHACASIFFADVVGFTPMCDKVSPARVLEFLNTIFSRFDTLCDDHDVHKMETAGDCYVASAGVVRRINKSALFEVKSYNQSLRGEGGSSSAYGMDACMDAERVLRFGLAAMAAVSRMRMPHDGTPVRIRVGIHSGPCVSGLVGTKLPKFAIFGDTINTASRMESTAPPGRIQVSNDTMQLIRGTGNAWCGCERNWEELEGVNVKGKGVMRTFLWRDPCINEPIGSNEPIETNEPIGSNKNERNTKQCKSCLCPNILTLMLQKYRKEGALHR